MLRGGHLYNSYRGQRNEAGRIPLPGLIALGDAVCTTNPSLGRGIATSLLQARQLLALLEEPKHDLASVALAFDAWCEEHIKPWFADHVYSDADLRRRGPAGTSTSRVGCHQTSSWLPRRRDPELNRTIMPYFMMRALPSSLTAIEPPVRELTAGGWRPAVPEDPSRSELAEVIAQTTNRQARAVRAAPRVVA